MSNDLYSRKSAFRPGPRHNPTRSMPKYQLDNSQPDAPDELSRVLKDLKMVGQTTQGLQQLSFAVQNLIKEHQRSDLRVGEQHSSHRIKESGMSRQLINHPNTHQARESVRSGARKHEKELSGAVDLHPLIISGQRKRQKRKFSQLDLVIVMQSLQAQRIRRRRPATVRRDKVANCFASYLLLEMPPTTPIGSSFYLFPYLPTELRLEIWGRARPDPQIVRLKMKETAKNEFKTIGQRIYSTSPIPGIVHACRESRAFAIENWYILNKNLPAYKDPLKYFFDPAHDFMYYGCDKCFGTISCQTCPNAFWELRVLRLAQRIIVQNAMGWRNPNNTWFFMDPFDHIGVWFSSIREIILLDPEVPENYMKAGIETMEELAESSYKFPWQRGRTLLETYERSRKVAERKQDFDLSFTAKFISCHGLAVNQFTSRKHGFLGQKFKAIKFDRSLRWVESEARVFGSVRGVRNSAKPPHSALMTTSRLRERRKRREILQMDLAQNLVSKKRLKPNFHVEDQARGQSESLWKWEQLVQDRQQNGSRYKLSPHDCHEGTELSENNSDFVVGSKEESAMKDNDHLPLQCLQRPVEVIPTTRLEPTKTQSSTNLRASFHVFVFGRSAEQQNVAPLSMKFSKEVEKYQGRCMIEYHPKNVYETPKVIVPFGVPRTRPKGIHPAKRSSIVG